MFKKNIVLLCIVNVALSADIDLQKGVYDAAEEMMAFDEKMNHIIAEHNGIEYEKESTSSILDFEERETYYVLERNIEDSNNTQIELTIKDGLLSIEVTVGEQEEIKTETGTTQETTFTQSISSLYIPYDADEKTLHESYKNGILKVTFNKK